MELAHGSFIRLRAPGAGSSRKKEFADVKGSKRPDETPARQIAKLGVPEAAAERCAVPLRRLSSISGREPRQSPSEKDNAPVDWFVLKENKDYAERRIPRSPQERQESQCCGWKARNTAPSAVRPSVDVSSVCLTLLLVFHSLIFRCLPNLPFLSYLRFWPHSPNPILSSLNLHLQWIFGLDPLRPLDI